MSAEDGRPGPQLDFLLQEPLDRGRGAEPLQRQLARRLREAVLDGRLPSGCRLPGSRALAAALGISRNSVTAVYDLLGAEGYVDPSRQGTRVAALARAPRRGGPTAAAHPAPEPARRAGRIPARPRDAGVRHALSPGVPALPRFPHDAWRRCVDLAHRRADTATLDYGPPCGEPALRTAIVRHLALARGVHCAPEQVVITEGAQEALRLCVGLVTDPGDTAWIEDPGYRGAQTAMAYGDLDVVPMRVDDGGLRVPESAWRTHPPRLIYTTPSHQYPTGAVMTAGRRLELIEKARAHGAWIVEDDYDSEFRHTGAPIGAMQSLVPDAPVLYVGTFSKTLFPALRIGFLVLPEPLVAPARPLLDQVLRGGHRHEQLALAEFIESGRFGRHIGRMRRLYRARKDALTAALAAQLTVPHTITGAESGMHLVVHLPRKYPDHLVAAAAHERGIAPLPLSRSCLAPDPEPNGLVLGYGNTPASAYPALCRTLDEVIEATATTTATTTATPTP
ncbi:PLP-dependent aminotransferase family protein [Streptomyces sp. NPDC050095]|uniref:MocR-like pyridoxine biosynthesis transcription factor PdxR n=1 Tax=unclassified Streptomyces TaxID=2593676 RepID=UPI00342061CF